MSFKNQKINQHCVVGVIQGGKGCGTPGIPGLYTKVSHYIPWIINIIWKQHENQTRGKYSFELEKLMPKLLNIYPQYDYKNLKGNGIEPNRGPDQIQIPDEIIVTTDSSKYVNPTSPALSNSNIGFKMSSYTKTYIQNIVKINISN